MTATPPELVDTLHGLVLRALTRISTDLSTLKELASAELALPGSRERVALVYQSAHRDCALIEFYLKALQELAHTEGGARQEPGKAELRRQEPREDQSAATVELLKSGNRRSG